MHILFLIALFFMVFFGPQIWAKHVLARYNREEYFSGNGFDFARLLIEKTGMGHVRVEATDLGDHYDPMDKVVRLNPATAGRRSLTAIVIAAHEVGHAIQDHTGFRPLALRTRLITFASGVEKAGAGLMVVIPLVALITRIPSLGLLMAGAGAASLLMPVFVHVFTLPVEFDSSFNRALPMLETGEFIPPEDHPAARQILTACALTYVAGALAGLLNVWRWLKLIRR